ncbi:hypothetical protein HU200_058273 [Digitaria exilis]|uniref:Uncharacterized protein n=1 Tax=Digitaria exilis TaxID=1010633 RepID=A0A835ADV1_9POAL|nr:hypothetical protein HU200_058273 [Digitaria exilis]
MRGAYSWRDNLSVDEIDRVLQRLQVMSCDLTEFIMLLQNCQPISRPIATNIFRDGQMFGRHVDKERIINFLLHEDDQSTEELGVLPIVGGNEIGKTTLVQYACDDARVRNHFPVIMLYNFSCTYDVKKNEGTPSEPLEYVQNNSFSDKRCLMAHAFAGRDIQDNPRLISGRERNSKEAKGVVLGAKIVGGSA